MPRGRGEIGRTSLNSCVCILLIVQLFFVVGSTSILHLGLRIPLSGCCSAHNSSCPLVANAREKTRVVVYSSAHGLAQPGRSSSSLSRAARGSQRGGAGRAARPWQLQPWPCIWGEPERWRRLPRRPPSAGAGHGSRRVREKCCDGDDVVVMLMICVEVVEIGGMVVVG